MRKLPVHALTNKLYPVVTVMCCLMSGMLYSNPGECQPTYLKASNAESNDFFGISAGISGSTIVIGAPGEDSSATEVNGDETNNSASARGAAYVFIRDQSENWSQQAYLKVSDWGGFGMPNIGQAVAISGETAVITSPWVLFQAGGASGRAYVFVRNGEEWAEQEIVGASPGGNGDGFGVSVAISGDTMVVGASFEDSNATGVDGDAVNDLAEQAGAAYVFVRNGDVWTQQAYLKSSNTGAGDRFGESVAISGDTVVVGAPVEASDVTGVDSTSEDNDLAASAGSAYVFVRDGDAWSQQAYLKASNTGAGDNFGWNVAVDGDTVVVGARKEDSDAGGLNGDGNNDDSDRSGAAYIFVRDEFGKWSQHDYVKASDAGIYDEFGSNVAISGDTIAISAEHEDDSVTDSGAVYLFVRDEAGNWSELGKAKGTYPNLADRLGISLGISGDLLVAGTWIEDSDVKGVNGGDGHNEGAKDSGAAYAWVVSQINNNDTIPPLVTAPPDKFVKATGEFTPVDLGMATATDNSTPTESIVIEHDWHGGGFPVGITTVTWTATDLAGNKGTDTQIVEIYEDQEPPCPDAIFCDGFEGDGNLPAAEISGMKWEDLNGDGHRDPGEPGLAGVIIYLDENRNMELDFEEPMTQTDDEGLFWFTDVRPGDHHVREIVPDGYFQTFPVGGSHLVHVESGMIIEGVEFGNLHQ